MKCSLCRKPITGRARFVLRKRDAGGELPVCFACMGPVERDRSTEAAMHENHYTADDGAEVTAGCPTCARQRGRKVVALREPPPS